jgi:hypothetical protein
MWNNFRARVKVWFQKLKISVKGREGDHRLIPHAKKTSLRMMLSRRKWTRAMFGCRKVEPDENKELTLFICNT